MFSGASQTCPINMCDRSKGKKVFGSQRFDDGIYKKLSIFDYENKYDRRRDAFDTILPC